MDDLVSSTHPTDIILPSLVNRFHIFKPYCQFAGQLLTGPEGLIFCAHNERQRSIIGIINEAFMAQNVGAALASKEVRQALAAADAIGNMSPFAETVRDPGRCALHAAATMVYATGAIPLVDLDQYDLDCGRFVLIAVAFCHAVAAAQSGSDESGVHDEEFTLIWIERMLKSDVFLCRLQSMEQVLHRMLEVG